MSSATISLFVSMVVAAIGAAAFAVIITHPGVVAAVASHILKEAHVKQAASSPSAPATQDARKRSFDGQNTVEIAAAEMGHFVTDAEINGHAINVMVDTGASLVALTYDDADRLGIYVKPSDFTYQAQTANGIARVAPVTIPRISIGDITVRNVQGIVSERGKSERTLLGMSFLGRLSRVEMRGQTLLLQE